MKNNLAIKQFACIYGPTRCTMYRTFRTTSMYFGELLNANVSARLVTQRQIRINNLFLQQLSAIYINIFAFTPAPHPQSTFFHQCF